MSDKIKTCPVENCRAKGGPANCRYHAGVLLSYADKVRALHPHIRSHSKARAELVDYGEKMIKWYKNNKKRALKKNEPAYDKGTPISSDEDVKKLYEAIMNVVDNPIEYEELTGATSVELKQPKQNMFSSQELDMLQTVHDFLRENEQYGDDWEQECSTLEKLITNYDTELLTKEQTLDTLQAVHDFLRENEQYGDDWEQECSTLENIFSKVATWESDESEIQKPIDPQQRIELTTLEETIQFANDLLDREDTIIIEASKPSGKFVKANQLTENDQLIGITYNRDGEFEQCWEAQPGEWLLTATDENGEPYLAQEKLTEKDKETIRKFYQDHGEEPPQFDSQAKHANIYPIPASDFHEKYDTENMQDGITEAKSIPQKFIILDEYAGIPEKGILLTQSWGGPEGTQESMKQGAALNITKIHDNSPNIYAIDPTFFKENYQITTLQPSELEPSTTYPTIWGDRQTFIGYKTINTYNEELDKHITTKLAIFEAPDGKTYLKENEIPQFIYKPTTKP